MLCWAALNRLVQLHEKGPLSGAPVADLARAAGEGAFGICSFWAAEYLALGGGTVEEAQEQLERLLGYANDVGLYAEEIDPESGGALGNFPQAYTHVGLINAALSLRNRLERGKVQAQKARIELPEARA